MRLQSPIAWLLACAAGAVLAGCASPQPRGEAAGDQIPRVSALYAKATEVHVHRFRKPHMDRQARMLQSLAEECDRMIAETQTWESSARLTAAGDAERNAVRGDIQALRSSLAGLRDAAQSRDLGAAGSAHSGALAAYGRIRNRVDVTQP